MAIKWLCTGKSEHGYQYQAAENDIQNSSVMTIDFKAEVDTEYESGSINELFDTKPVLTEAGVEAFVGLQVYPQGFTVYVDKRLSNIDATGVLLINGEEISFGTLYNLDVGGFFGTNAGGGGPIVI